MALKNWVLALGMIAAASPLSAASAHGDGMTAAPSGSADTRYCMRIAPFTGSLLEQVRCWTRDQWAGQGVDVDQDWARNGIRTRG